MLRLHIKTKLFYQGDLAIPTDSIIIFYSYSFSRIKCIKVDVCTSQQVAFSQNMYEFCATHK